MSELSPEANALIDLGRGADGPSAADKARVHAALMARLGAPPPGGDPGHGPASSPGHGLDAAGTSTLGQGGAAAGAAHAAPGLMSTLVAKLAAGVATVGVLGLGGYLLLRQPAQPGAPRAAAVQAAVQAAQPVERAAPIAVPAPALVADLAPAPVPVAEPAPAAGVEPVPVAEPAPAAGVEPVPVARRPPDSAPAPAERVPAPEPPAELPAQPSRRTSDLPPLPSPSASASLPAAAEPLAGTQPASPALVDIDAVSRLREEQALIGSAKRALEQDVPRRALIYLNQHGEQFPAGMLAEERAALKAIALCEAGEVAGQQERDQFLARWPSSPHAAAVRSACPH